MKRQKEWFDRADVRGAIGQYVLFLGPDGVGNARSPNSCQESAVHRSPSGKLEPCGACEDCAQVNAMTHPDLIEVSKPADKSNIPWRLSSVRRMLVAAKAYATILA